MKRRSIIALIFVLATGITALYVLTEPGGFDRGDQQLRDIASVTSLQTPKTTGTAVKTPPSLADLFAIEKEAPSTNASAGAASSKFDTGVVTDSLGCGNSVGAATDCVSQPPENAFLQWARNVYRRIQSWVSSSPATTGIRVETGPPRSAHPVPLDQVAQLETRRAEVNRVFAGSAHTLAPAGDAELFYRMMAFVKEAAPTGPANGGPNGSKSTRLSTEQQRIFEAWRAASENANLNGDEYWRDQKYFYRYAAHLALGGLIGPRSLTSPENFLSILNGALSTQKNVNRSDFFSEQTQVSLGEPQLLSRNISRRSLISGPGKANGEIGFLLENNAGSGTGAPFIFVYNRQGMNYEKIPTTTFQSKAVIADLPGPMHADGARLIELGIRGGRVVNFLMGGGARRSGLVVVTPEGRAFPFHVQAISPSIWGSKSTVGTLDLSRSYQDLISFLTIAKEERLSVFMEMLLAEEADANAGLTPIKNFANARGRRLLVWKKQTDGLPSLLVVNRDLSINHAVWAAHKLGYRWAVNLDVDFIDGARAGSAVFGTANDGAIRNPYSRLLFLDER